jgi:serine/threonine-protein kinase
VAVCVACRSIIENVAHFCPHCGLKQPDERPALRIEPGSEVDIEDWGKVVVGERIGEGGMGIVLSGWLYYSPHARYAGRAAHPVAVKVLHPLLRGRDRARQLFLREATALERLNHPNIVRFHAFVQDPRQLALVFELVEGQPLDELIAARVLSPQPGIPCMPFMQAWHYFSQLLGALAATHALGILHRDVKPSNVLIRTDGVAKLTDYGIARVPADEVSTTGGMAPGTGAYMSPEQVIGKELDPRTDLYSAAIVLYEMLTGVSPFELPGANEIAIRTAQVEQSPPPLTHYVPHAPPVLDVLMARALAKDPVHRYPSALEMGEAFRAALDLPKTQGWDAQRRFAEQAVRISQLARAALPPTDPAGPSEPDALRTGIMAAYGRGQG